MTPNSTLLLAVLLQGFLTFGLLFWLGSKRLPRVKSGDIRVADIAISQDAWPKDAQQASNAFGNQFQLPTLFYVAAGMALYLTAGWLDVFLALAFVLSRFGHALIHITTNHVQTRFLAYTAGLVILMAWWVLLAIRILFLSGGAAS